MSEHRVMDSGDDGDHTHGYVEHEHVYEIDWNIVEGRAVLFAENDYGDVIGIAEIIRRVHAYPVLMGKLEHANSFDETSSYDEHGEGLAWHALTNEQKAYWIEEAVGRAS